MDMRDIRTAQVILAERRANINELRRENDPTARAMLRAHINMLTNELEALRSEMAVSR